LCAASALPALAQTPPTITLPDVTVTAQKEPAPVQELPVSVTAITAGMLERAGVSIVSDAAWLAPNTVFTEFTARKLSNARFRGLGASPANPAITTFIDGVPMLHANASSLELVAVDQIEFVRGPQSALFGRNTLGGLVNISSARPSLGAWTGQLMAPLGDNGNREIRGTISGPLTDTLALGVAIGHGERDGFTTNSVTGNRIDDRQGTFGKVQLLWTPTARWETRVIVGGERSRDGDYTLSDLAGLRDNPFAVARDFEGYQNRDVASATLLARYEGDRISVSSTTGYVRWETRDVTDLDYTPQSLITRDNMEEARQFTQELRVASAASAPIRLSDTTSLAWQVGGVAFTQNYEQDAINQFSPFLGFPIAQHAPKGTLDDLGFGAFAQATFSFADRVDLGVGARADRETKDAALDTFFDPAIAPPTAVTESVTYSNVSPNASLTVHLRPGTIAYATAGRGYKAGGFNPAAPPAAEAYGEEQTWTVEGGAKTTFADGRVIANAAAFYIDWTDLQLNLPIPMNPGQFYIANVGGATSRGLELEVMARAARGVDLFGSLGLTRARFADGSTSSGVDVSDKRLPFTPDYTASFGIQVTRQVGSTVTAFGRADLVRYGAFDYDDANTAGQAAYGLTNLRAGVQLRSATIEGWMKNVFDTRYIPTAFAYGLFAPSGFVGESGRPRTMGITIGVGF
jgi:iron complex outermembrane receptor protein